MTDEALDDALCICTANTEPGWIPRQVAQRDIKAAFSALRRERDEALRQGFCDLRLAGEISGARDTLAGAVVAIAKERDAARACINFFVAGARMDDYEPSYLARAGWIGLCEIYDALNPPEIASSEA